MVCLLTKTYKQKHVYPVGEQKQVNRNVFALRVVNGINKGKHRYTGKSKQRCLRHGTVWRIVIARWCTLGPTEFEPGTAGAPGSLYIIRSRCLWVLSFRFFPYRHCSLSLCVPWPLSAVAPTIVPVQWRPRLRRAAHFWSCIGCSFMTKNSVSTVAPQAIF
jgi:hypothetical protein